jgi:hypothetical protein
VREPPTPQAVDESRSVAQPTLNLGIVQTDDLHIKPKNQPADVVKAIDYTEDIDSYIEMQTIDEKRMKLDILTRLLYDRDDTELERYVLGIIAEPNTTDQGRPGIIYEMTVNEIGTKAVQALHNLQYIKTSGKFEDDPSFRRLQYHFILFVTLALDEGFVQFVSLKTYSSHSLISFINYTLKPLLSEFMQGNMIDSANSMLHKQQTAASQLYQFVNKCRTEYLMQCMPKDPQM